MRPKVPLPRKGVCGDGVAVLSTELHRLKVRSFRVRTIGSSPAIVSRGLGRTTGTTSVVVAAKNMSMNGGSVVRRSLELVKTRQVF